MKTKYLSKLEYPSILEILSHYAKTYLGKQQILAFTPLFEEDVVTHLLQETDEAIRLRYRQGALPLESIPDITAWLKCLSSHQSLSIKALLELTYFLTTCRKLKDYIGEESTSFPLLSHYFSSLYANKQIEEKISYILLDESTIADQASPTLSHIRRKKRNLEQTIKDRLHHILHSSSYQPYIQDSVVTLRNDRYVIPVKTEYRSQIKGFLHDTSSSGSTVFIEPIAVFDANNEIQDLLAEEKKEIAKILKELSHLFVPIVDELTCNITMIGHIDVAFAKANYAIAIHATIPTINHKKIVSLKQARHPLISEDKVVPIDLTLGEKFSTLVITGPNTGGKTVTLKTVGLLTLMALSGLAIPANENSSIYVFDQIYADIGDEQNIGESLSIFSSHLLNIIDIVEHATPNSLILVDELGSGTDPTEGSCLAISLLEHFHKQGALTIATTHYPEIKQYALVENGFENASQEFDLEHLRPTYHLLIGVPGKSNAFAISKKLGLSSSIITRANALMDSDTATIEELLKEIHDDKLILAKEKEETHLALLQAKALQQQLEAQEARQKQKEKEYIETAKLEAKQILLEAKETASRLIKEMSQVAKGNTNSNKQLNTIRSTLNEKIKSLSPTAITSSPNNGISLSKEKILIGMPVYITTLNQEGHILSLPNKANKVQVQIGSLKTTVSLNDLTPSHSKSNTNYIPKSTKNSHTFKTRSASTEINVVGQNIEEATFLIDKYLDDCVLAKLETVRIIHGKGTGKLREGIHAFLKKHPHVKGYRVGSFGEGEMGATIVTLK